MLGWLSLPLLLAVAVLLGAGQPMSNAARMVLTRAVVPGEQLTRAGLKTIWADPVLRATMMLFATINCLAARIDLIAVVILRDQSVHPAMIGLALGGGAVGGLAGAPLVKPLHRLAPGVLMITVCAAFVPLTALLAVPLGPWWMAGLLFVGMLGVPSIRVLADVLLLRQAPQAERGRVVAAVMTLLGVGIPAGLALAGILAAGIGICAARPQLWAARWPQ